MWKWVFVALLAAVSLQAEDYCFGFLNAVADRKEIPEAEVAAIQEAHLAHMNRMNQAGRLLAAGPILTGGNIRGIVVYRCKSLDEAREWTAIDPAVKNGRLTFEFAMWRGPKGFGEPLMSMLQADPNAKYKMVQLPLVLLKKTSSWTMEPVEQIADQNREAAALRKAGKLRAAGPVVDAKSLGGIMVFSAMKLEEAERTAKEMPLVRSGYATVQALNWLVATEAVPVP